MSKTIRKYDPFEYHLEDLDCSSCQFYKRKSKNRKTGCGLDTCRFEDIRADAIANGRFKRKRGWNK